MHDEFIYMWVDPRYLTPHQLRVREKLQKKGPLGLSLDHSSFYPTEPEPEPVPEKMKANSVPASVLKIGSWQRVAKNPSDLVAKWYFAKRKLVWEILDGGLKSKIEIQWSDIIAIHADIRADHPGILRVELKQCPTFHEETDPQPKKHTIWKPAPDFTGGEASACRRHHIMFPAGELDKPYEKLLQYDERLLLLSQMPFPSLQDPNFLTYCGATEFCLDNNPLQASSSMAAAGRLQQYRSYSRMENPLRISVVMDFSHSDNDGVTMWGEQQSNSYEVGNNNSGFVAKMDYTMAAMGNLPDSYQHQIKIGSQLNGYLSQEFPPGDENLMLLQRLKAVENMAEQDIDTELYTMAAMDSLSDSYQHQIGSQLNGHLSQEFPPGDENLRLLQRLKAVENMAEQGIDAELYNQQQHQQQRQVFGPDHLYQHQQQQEVSIPNHLYQHQQQLQVFVPNHLYQHQQQQQVFIPDHLYQYQQQQQVFLPHHLYQQQHPGNFGNPYPDENLI
ncbi:hypothetical protein LINPERHAP1_LOCUS16574 [Linum perenne]